MLVGDLPDSGFFSSPMVMRFVIERRRVPSAEIPENVTAALPKATLSPTQELTPLNPTSTRSAPRERNQPAAISRQASMPSYCHWPQESNTWTPSAYRVMNASRSLAYTAAA
jgi:hypothetical protein